jgi:hypothetical protein
MNWAKRINLLFFLTFSTCIVAQNSPFAVGKWAKLSTSKQGIYKLTGAQIRSMGFDLPMVASQLQLFNYPQRGLQEKVPSTPLMGLVENSIKVVDGGDGKIDDSDYILFYAVGPVQWKYDSLTKVSSHSKNIPIPETNYFITIGNNGKRIPNQNLQTAHVEDRDYFTQHFLYEIDSVSLLNSGKTFFGLPMGTGIGKQPAIQISYNTQSMGNAGWIQCNTHVAATNYQSNSQFDYYWNDQFQQSTLLPPVTGYLFDDVAKEASDRFFMNSNATWPSKSTLKLSYNSPNANATGWIDYVELTTNKQIGFWQDSSIAFGIEEGIHYGDIVKCNVQNGDASVVVWNVTNAENPAEITTQWLSNGKGSFLQKTDSTCLFFATKNNAFETPVLGGSINNQNTVNNIDSVNYIIVAAPAYLAQAKKYQQFQQSNFGRKTIVVDARELYNDFSGGQASPIAIRNFLKYLSNKAVAINAPKPEYVLLLGMGNFNTKKLRLDFELPVYENENATSILSSFSTDDFFSILNTGADINAYGTIGNLSMAVGRIPARTIAEADTAITKLIRYQSNKVGGAWENNITWIADDGDYNLHLQDAESIVQNVQTKTSFWDHNKIYLDLFPAVSSTSGNSFPLANNALQQAIQEGSLMLNYTGHGNYLRLAEEAIIAQSQLDSWTNRDKLPLLVTASCNFAPYDQPSLSPIAWDAFMKNSNGVIGLVAANRLVFAFSNRQINDLFVQQLLVSDASGKLNTIGQALQKAKNSNWAQGGDKVNDFKFNIIGDPALRLSRPNYQVHISHLNGQLFTGKDSLLSGNKYQLQGQVKVGNAVKGDFNGTLELIIYDAVKQKRTLANQSTSMAVPVDVQENILFKGKASVVNGLFTVGFILPTQVSNVTNPIKIKLAAVSGSNSAIQVYDSIFVKPNGSHSQGDKVGPTIKAYLNDAYFKAGGWSAPNATLFISLMDSSGIQTSGNALGHDLVVYMDNNPIPLVLNKYFTADMDTYQSGKVVASLPQFTEGKHLLVIKAWDLLGNGSKDTLLFEVPKLSGLQNIKPFNFPNPFITQTKFGFETNQVDKELDLLLEIYDQKGQSQFSYARQFKNTATKVFIDWNGITNTGTALQPGVYFYKITVKSNSGTSFLANSFIKL